jgi:hypothetical protein
MVKTQRVADEHLRIEFGRVDTGGAKFCSPGAPRIGNRKMCPCSGNNGLPIVQRI